MVANTLMYCWYHTPKCRQAQKEWNRATSKVNAASRANTKANKGTSAEQKKASLGLSDALMKHADAYETWQEAHSECVYGSRWVKPSNAP